VVRDVKLTGRQLRALAHEMRQTADALDAVADAADDDTRPYNYPDYSTTARLYAILDEPPPRRAANG
jgi:hypothetical protein